MRVIGTRMEKMALATSTTRHASSPNPSVSRHSSWGSSAETKNNALQRSGRHVNARRRDCGEQVLLISNPHVVPTPESSPSPPFLLPRLHPRIVAETATAATRTLVSEETGPSSSCLVACL